MHCKVARRPPGGGGGGGHTWPRVFQRWELGGDDMAVELGEDGTWGRRTPQGFAVSDLTLTSAEH